MSQKHYNSQDSDFAAAVAATALAIYSAEEGEAGRRRNMRKDSEKTKEKVKTRKEDTGAAAGSVGATRVFFGKDVHVEGETSSRRQRTERERRVQESGFSNKRPSRSSSMRPATNPADQRQKGRSRVGDNKADSWEINQLRKINKRYEKMKSKVDAWENAKKMEAKLRMERKKNELEQRRVRNLQHYGSKIARIDLIAEGARGQLEDKKKNEEAEVKEKAKHKRSKGKSPMKCFFC